MKEEQVITLEHPVCTLEGKVLLQAGTGLSGETLESLKDSPPEGARESRNFLDHGSIRNDLTKLFATEPYFQIFPGPQVEETMRDMEVIELDLPILRAMDYFRERDFFTYRHSLIVFALSTLLAKDLVPDYRRRLQVDATGPTQDIGKICVPIKVLVKATPLTRSERSLLNHHALAGYVLLCHYLGNSDSLACRVARDHHERKNGSGYPQGMRLEDRVVEIIAVCDVYDALIAPRPYRPVSYDNRSALEELTAMVGRGEIGQNTVKALIAHNRRVKKDYRECNISHEKRGTSPPDNLYGVTVEDKGGPEGESGREGHEGE
jgi:HD-GYP domain-containing protein (c-di-GMP phosphodiesterase class II)